MRRPAGSCNLVAADTGMGLGAVSRGAMCWPPSSRRRDNGACTNKDCQSAAPAAIRCVPPTRPSVHAAMRKGLGRNHARNSHRSRGHGQAVGYSHGRTCKSVRADRGVRCARLFSAAAAWPGARPAQACIMLVDVCCPPAHSTRRRSFETLPQVGAHPVRRPATRSSTLPLGPALAGW